MSIKLVQSCLFNLGRKWQTHFRKTIKWAITIMLNRSCMCPCFKMLHVIHCYIYIYTVQDVSNCPAVIKVVTSKVQWGSSCDFVLMISIRSFLPFQKFFTLLKNKQSTSQTKSATENPKKHSTPVFMAQSVLLWFVFLLATIIIYV